MTSRRIADRWWVVADSFFVIIFVVIGHVNHHHGLSPAAITSTLWPFAVGLLGGVLRVTMRRESGYAIRSGIAVALITVAIGMVLRVVAGQGTAFAFIIVAIVFLGASMQGWRLVVRFVRR